MSQTIMTIVLADDDEDDQVVFQDALQELSSETSLVIAGDGIELMEMLHNAVPALPDVIFLDINMPRKNGLECLSEIRSDTNLKDARIVIFSTSCEQQIINTVHQKGADFYLCKPDNFLNLKSAISKVLSINWRDYCTQPSREKFQLNF